MPEGRSLGRSVGRQRNGNEHNSSGSPERRAITFDLEFAIFETLPLLSLHSLLRALSPSTRLKETSLLPPLLLKQWNSVIAIKSKFHSLPATFIAQLRRYVDTRAPFPEVHIA